MRNDPKTTDPTLNGEYAKVSKLFWKLEKRGETFQYKAENLLSKTSLYGWTFTIRM
jgi:hypothetical protein